MHDEFQRAISWSEFFWWSPALLAGALQLLGAMLGAGVVLFAGAKQLVAARESRENEMKRRSYERLVEPLIDQTMRLLGVYAPSVVSELGAEWPKLIRPAMEVHLFASADAIAALMESSRWYAAEMVYAAFERPPIDPLGPTLAGRVLDGNAAVIRYSEQLVPLLVAARKDLGLDRSAQESERIEAQLRDHFANLADLPRRAACVHYFRESQARAADGVSGEFAPPLP